jgi:two-component system cell cycle sensor histidine kinase/response regulator CckA
MTDTQTDAKQVLVAEDEPMVRNLLRRLLSSWGYRVFSARNGREAMEIADAHKGEIDLLISDVALHKMHGPELAEKLKAKRPKLQVILLSACLHTRLGVQRGWKFIKTPLRPKELKAAVEDSLR